MSGRERKAKRIKLECSVCQMTFDSDYRKKHNEKYHGDMLSAHRHIPYKAVGAPENPFMFSKRSKTPAGPVPAADLTPESDNATTPGDEAETEGFNILCQV